jgi:AraC-like DNA-binding protein
VDLSAVTFDSHQSEAYSWTMAHRLPHPGLADHVSGYTGYVERSVLPLRRREVANGSVVMIISFGDSIDVKLSADPAATRQRSFVAGLHDGFVFNEHGGRQTGVQVDLTPLGAYRVLGVPPSEFANGVVPLDALGSRALAELADRLASAADWPARFDLLDRAFLRWAAEGPQPDTAVSWAWGQLRRAHGQVAVKVLADEIGWSHRHFVARFRHHIGLAPKPTARVLRFQRAVELLTADDSTTISDVAASCGYADHSHLVRDFRDLAGCTPSALLGARLPDGPGIAG